jgi:hypothetical protein
MFPDNLWGELPSVDEVRTPNMILSEQAAKLGELTRNILRGEVSQVSDVAPGFFAYALDIVAPVLDDFRVTVLRVSHALALYPVAVEDPFDDSPGWDEIPTPECQSQEEFVGLVRRILGSRAVHGVIANLLAQSRAVK